MSIELGSKAFSSGRTLDYRRILKPQSIFSLSMLLISNIIAARYTIRDAQALGIMLWSYWLQNLAIGASTFVQIRLLKNFSTDDLISNGKRVDPTPQTRNEFGWFFAMHYGFFHLIYLVFLLINPGNIFQTWITHISSVLIIGGVFFVNHFLSAFVNRLDESTPQNIGMLMFTPYLRILPMHTIIIFAALLGSSRLVFFLILKTLADLAMDALETARLR